ncbi:SDR family NAD(P)-dependent oxidoreductase [Corallococcus terminator]|uniref:SDR family NAD(P)-dependent oxidoreductase n=1 Tax=Corallococcus terminator TaxID=2316733 RepID=UPI0013156570
MSFPDEAGWTGRTVLVTGGSSGIGAQIVRAMAAQGDRVWLTYHRGEERALALLQEVGGDGDRGHLALPLDQGNWAQVQELVSKLPGPVDIRCGGSVSQKPGSCMARSWTRPWGSESIRDC